MKRTLVFLMAVLLPVMAQATIDVMPKVVGSAATDSVIVSWGTIDTTYYPVVLDADSLIILIYPPDNAAPESTADGGTGVLNLSTGYYEYHRRGANATPDIGYYRVCVKAWRGAGIRGIGTASYYVTAAGTNQYALHDSTRDLAKDSLAVAVTDVNKANFKATGFATSTQGDSITLAITDVNKANFKATGFATSTQGDSVTLAIEDVNKVNFMATLIWNGTQRDSVLNAITDAGKLGSARDAGDTVLAHAPHGDNWSGAGSWSTGQRDSVLAAIEDAGKLGRARDGADTTIVHAPHGDNWAGGGSSNWSDPQRDSVLAAITDAGKLGRARDGADTVIAHAPHGDDWASAGSQTWNATQRDSVLNTILDVNKVNFMRWTAAQRDSVLNTILDVNKVNFKATGFATSTQGDSMTLAITDVNKANLRATGFATSTQGDSITLAITDVNKANFQATGFATPGDAMTLQDDSLNTLMTDIDGIKTKTDNLPNDPADDGDIDAQLSSIQQDLDNPNQYKAAGFSVPGDAMTLQNDSLQTLMANMDSVTGAITDVNKVNFKGSLDSVEAAITDANKVNFKATGFAVAGDAMTLQNDSLNTLMTDVDAVKERTDNLPNDPAVDSDIDNQLGSIQTDLNNPAQYKASGFATADSVHNAISDVNKANFKYGGGADSVRAYLATHDSTLLEQAASGVELLNMFFGACDSCYYHLYPIGEGNKDSLIIFSSDGTRSGKVVYKYGAVASIVDTAYFYMAPWW